MNQQEDKDELRTKIPGIDLGEKLPESFFKNIINNSMKTTQNESVLHDWVHTLTFQQQALLMTGMRGPDSMPKKCPAKCLTRFMRGAVLKPAGEWDGLNNNDFMWGDYSKFGAFAKPFFNDPDGYPHHFMMHLIHCAEVLGYKHPDNNVAMEWKSFYFYACKSFHMKPETEEQMDERLDDFGYAMAKQNP